MDREARVRCAADHKRPAIHGLFHSRLPHCIRPSLGWKNRKLPKKKVTLICPPSRPLEEKGKKTNKK